MFSSVPVVSEQNVAGAIRDRGRGRIRGVFQAEGLGRMALVMAGCSHSRWLLSGNAEVSLCHNQSGYHCGA